MALRRRSKLTGGRKTAGFFLRGTLFEVPSLCTMGGGIWEDIMQANRRTLLYSALGLSVAGPIRAAYAADTASLAPLRAAGLNPFDTYVRMFGSLSPGAEVCWWFMGALPREIDNIGAVDTVQEETVRVHRTEVVGPGQITLNWKQAGVFRDVVTGEMPENWINPVSGAAEKQSPTLKGGPSKIAVRQSGNDLVVAADVPGAAPAQAALEATVDGDRVGLTHVEDKTRQTPNGPSTNRTVFRIYASLAELKGAAPSVAARGFYGVRNLGTGRVFVNGMMQKAAMDAKVNPIAWQRIKAAHPAFFKGDRLAPGWDG